MEKTVKFETKIKIFGMGCQKCHWGTEDVLPLGSLYNTLKLNCTFNFSQVLVKLTSPTSGPRANQQVIQTET